MAERRLMEKWEDVGIRNLPTCVVIKAENEVVRRARLKARKERQWARDMRLILHTIAGCEIFVLLALLDFAAISVSDLPYALTTIAVTVIGGFCSKSFVVHEESEDCIDILEEWGYL